jgi:hypothetical protein
VNLCNGGAPGPAKGRIKLVVGKLRFGHYVLEQLSVVDQYLGSSLDDCLKRFVPMGHEAHQKIQTYQRGRGDETSDQGIVACVHRVLDGIRQHKQQNQIEGRELSHLSLSRDAQQRQKKDINYHASEDQFPPGNSHIQHT